MEFQINLYHDLRRAKPGKVYPVKIRVWNRITRKAKLYTTTFDLSEKDFQATWISQKPRKEFQQIREELKKIEAKAQDAAKELTQFTFDDFERKLYRKKGDSVNIIFHYNQAIENYKKNGQVGTASNYDLSLKSIFAFYRKHHSTEKNPTSISFYEITSEWLKHYEKFMIGENKSYTTVGIYLRPLRAIFNKAISENEIKSDIYPFGKRKYQIPASKNTKKALSKEQLRQFFFSVPKTPEQQKAKDFWFFSYACNGMNVKDIAMLRFKDIKDGAITFYRAKTINTSKGNLKQITAYLNDFTTNVIEKYGNKNTNADNYIFEILKANSTPTEQKRAILNFTRFVNQHIKKLCEENKLQEVSTYWARHTFATNSVREGASMEFIQECLGHGNLKTTMNYFAGFEDETKKEFAKKLMEF